MNGELIFKGYKFSGKLILNLQDMTVLTGEDNFMAFEIFNMLESYFSKKTFSNYYLDQGTVLILNGNKLTGKEFAVFRLGPTVNLAEELKITKKSILGQVANNLFEENNALIKPVIEVMQTNILNHLNDLTKEYGVSFICEADGIFSLGKIIDPVATKIRGQHILLNEQDQYYCKTMFVDFISKLNIEKKKLLLLELPEYGLRKNEAIDLFRMLSTAPIDNVIIFTNNMDISKIIPQVFNYNVIRNGKLCGFDDYDELEKQLQTLFIDSSQDKIEQKVIEYILHPQLSQLVEENEFSQIIENFLNTEENF